MRGGAAPPEGPRARSSAWIFISLAGTAAGITLLYLGMRAVLDIGGFCAEGGPYVIEHPCPHGVAGVMMGGIWGGIAFAGVYGYSAFRHHVPSLVGYLWPALFLSLGWNFLEYAFRPPQGSGIVWGWLIPGVLFVLMGGAPLLLLVPASWRRFREAPLALLDGVEGP